MFSYTRGQFVKDILRWAVASDAVQDAEYREDQDAIVLARNVTGGLAPVVLQVEGLFESVRRLGRASVGRPSSAASRTHWQQRT